jgi:hypothetical protein
MPLRSTIVGAASGVLLLAGVVGFAVGLPELTGDEAGATDGDGEGQEAGDGRPAADLLPATMLDGALQRYPDIDPQYAEAVGQVETYGSDKLTEVFESQSAVGLYTTPDLQVQVAVTIYDGESGLFLQQGPPVPPEMAVSSQTVGDIVRQGESVCIAQWESQAFTQDGPPFQAQCQRVVAGRTVNVYASPGLTIEQTAELVDDVVAQAELD